ncbi:MAG: two-component system, chemotaxis family, protein-glutamate methylesterase/glutaminase [Thermoleophilaceae bacterium]|jgi:two-component system chemotaxis response regulator CheB|nr:two-component system, chemotaxis family, protein-glutamate methylesterase/glutaminase [Thermoleophilaceae bacterium]
MAYELIAIGASWGGMHAIGRVLESLPGGFELPVVIAQHRPAANNEELLERILARSSQLDVVGASDKEPLVPGRVYVAPSDYHLLVERGHLALSTDDVVQFARPSIDVLFESAADAYAERAVGVLLTGVNEDGAAGLARIAAAGGFTVAQDPATAEQPDMPAAAIARGAARRVLALEQIGPLLAGLRPAIATGGDG